MVRYRSDPRGCSTPELYKWQSSLGPFRRISYA